MKRQTTEGRGHSPAFRARAGRDLSILPVPLRVPGLPAPSSLSLSLRKNATRDSLRVSLRKKEKRRRFARLRPPAHVLIAGQGGLVHVGPSELHGRALRQFFCEARWSLRALRTAIAAESPDATMLIPAKPWEAFRRPAPEQGKTIGELIAAELAQLKAIGDPQRNNRKSKLKSALDAFGDRLPSTLERAEVEAWVEWLKTLREANTVRAAFYVFKSRFETWAAEGLCSPDAVRLRKGVVPGKRTRAGFDAEAEILTPPELEALLDASPLEYRAIYAVLYGTGVRASEAIALTWGDYRRDRLLNALFVVKQRHQATGKTIDTKTKIHGKRPVPRFAEAILAEWRDHLGGPAPGDLLLPHRLTRGVARGRLRPHDQTHLLESFGAHLFAVGLRSRRIHSARHTFISLLLGAGADTSVVRRMTHARDRDAFSVYSHFSWETLCEAVSKFPLEPKGGAR